MYKCCVKTFDSTPCGQMPFGQMPFGQMPFGQMPFGQMPFGQMPFGPTQATANYIFHPLCQDASYRHSPAIVRESVLEKALYMRVYVYIYIYIYIYIYRITENR